MRMLSQQAMVASQMKRAANDKAIAQMLASDVYKRQADNKRDFFHLIKPGLLADFNIL